MATISEHDALPAGTRLGEFEIQKILGVGGFGIVYLAMDHALQRQVAIKEYMPAALAARGPDLDIVVRSASAQDTFTLGLRSFVNEARLLARFDHPSLVKVYRFWEAKGTAYMVMPYYQGQTLLQVRRAMSGPPDETWLRRLIMPLLGALECLHKENVYHRDIAPDNILLLDDEDGPGKGRPVLLDLGAARRVIGDHSQTLTAIVKPSFAPIEQYAETVQIRQGPWTDLYALAAVVHFCITGRPPMPATARAVQDELPTLKQLSAGLASGFDCHLSASFVNAIDHALAVRPQDRPDSIAAWREALSGIVSSPTEAGQGASVASREPQTVLVRQEGQEASPGHKAIEAQAFMTTIPAAGTLRALPAWPADRRSTEAMPATVPLAPPAPVAPPEPRDGVVPAGAEGRAQGGLLGGLKWALAALLLLGVFAIWWLQRTSHKGPAPHTAEGAPSVLSQPASKGGSAGVKLADAGQTAPAVPAEGASATKARRQPRQETAVARKDGDRDADAAEPKNPRKACAGKSFILLAICMKRHCSRPEYAGHAECERMRQQEAAQRTNHY